MKRDDTLSAQDPPPTVGDVANARFRLALQALGVGVAILDLEGRVQEANPALVQMFGYGVFELSGQPLPAFLHPDDAPGASECIANARADGAAAGELRVRWVHRDGATVWLGLGIQLVRGEERTPPFLLLQARDLGAEGLAEVERDASLARRSQALDATQVQLQLFADAVAHDLRAPLRSIESFSGLLARRAVDRLDETDQDYLARVRAAAATMSGLLSGLSELSAATRADLKPSDVDLGLLAEWVAAELQESEPDRAADIVVQSGLHAWGDERLLKQLLGQLMGNAWKFSRERDSTRIEVSGQRNGGTLLLTVTDAGIGFDSRYAHKLFEPFQRLHGVDRGGGHGLGLAIAQRIAERHGGNIRAGSQPEGGATFTVELPAPAAADEDRSDA